MTDLNLNSDEALEQLRSRLVPPVETDDFKFKPREQGNYFCTRCFAKVLHCFGSIDFVRVYISRNHHDCDECGASGTGKYRVMLPHYFH